MRCYCEIFLKSIFADRLHSLADQVEQNDAFGLDDLFQQHKRPVNWRNS
jgi:hypothetical protein